MRLTAGRLRVVACFKIFSLFSLLFYGMPTQEKGVIVELLTPNFDFSLDSVSHQIKKTEPGGHVARMKT
jgi:hypothetical protein